MSRAPLIAVALTACADPAEPLELAALSDEHVAGTYARGGVFIEFEMSRAGDRREATVRAADGTTLLHSTLNDGVATNDTIDYLAARPEVELLRDLVDALVDAGASERLVGGAHRHPLDLGDAVIASGAYYPCGSWLYPGQIASCGTAFLGYTSLRVYNCTYANASVWESHAGHSWIPSFVPTANPWNCGVWDFSGWYGGATVFFKAGNGAEIYMTH